MEPSQWAQLAGVTLAMSILAVAGAGVVSLPMSFAAANNFLLPGGLLDIGRSGVLQQTFSVALLLASRLLLLVACISPALVLADHQLENLTRGLVAVRCDDGSVFVSWRLFATDPDSLGFHQWDRTFGGSGVDEQATWQKQAFLNAVW